MFEQLGIYGMQKVEMAILAGLVTGDPVLLIGSHGSAKTLLCRRLAEALNLEFWAYDASKTMFEDVIGFPNPKSLTAGRVDYAPTAVSIWGRQFVLIDEISRAAPPMQNKWLEVIRSRRIMGKELPDLRYIFSAMNPTSYLGAHVLDEALAGRFAVIVTVPEVGDMSQTDLESIMKNVTEEDAPCVNLPWSASTSASSSNPAPASDHQPPATALSSFIQRARSKTETLPPKVSRFLDVYVMEFVMSFQSRDIALDGRRVGMIRRTLQAYLAISELLANHPRSLDSNLSDFIEDFHGYVTTCLPFAALDMDISPLVIKSAHESAWQAATTGKRTDRFRLPPDPVSAVRYFVDKQEAISEEEKKATITRFIAAAKTDQPSEKAGPALVAAVMLAKMVCDGRLNVSADDKYRVLEFYNRLTCLPEKTQAGILQGNEEIDIDTRNEIWETPHAVLARRMAVNQTEHQHYGIDESQAEELAKIIRETLAHMEEER